MRTAIWNTRIRTVAVVLWAVGVAALARAQTPAGLLMVGDKAPNIQVTRLVKDSGFESFKSGRVTVVEFFATWCPICRSEMPRMSQLAEKYASKVDMVGVAVWEKQSSSGTQDIVGGVKSYVQTMDSKIRFPIVVDTEKNWMLENWVYAAAQETIPLVYIVDQNGILAWIGSPATLDKVLGQVVAGKWDVAKERELAMKGLDQKLARIDYRKAMSAVSAQLQEAYASKDLKTVLATLDKVLEEHPLFESQIGIMRYDALLYVDEKRAYDYGRKLADGIYKDNWVQLNTMAWYIAQEFYGQLKEPNYKMALAFAERALTLIKEQPTETALVKDTAALLHYRMGNLRKAVTIQREAIELLRKGAEGIDRTTLAEMHARLAMYEAALEGSGKLGA